MNPNAVRPFRIACLFLAHEWLPLICACFLPWCQKKTGDEMNMHVPQSTPAEAECRYLLHVNHNVVDGGTNKAVFGAVHDTMTGAYLMTLPDALVPIELLLDTAMQQKYNHREVYEVLPSSKLAPGTKVPAWWAIDVLFPRDFCYDHDGVNIVDGRIQPGSGPFTKKHAGNGSSSIGFVLALDYGNSVSVEWLSDLGRTAYVFMTQHYGLSVSLSDMDIPDDVLAAAHARIDAACDAAATRVTERDQLESISGAMLSASAALEKTGYMDTRNGMHVMVGSGAKGSRLNVQQLMVAVGQQVIGSSRPLLNGDGRTMSCFRPRVDATNAQCRGMIKQSYCFGLGPIEHFFHASAARKGLSETVRDPVTLGCRHARRLSAHSLSFFSPSLCLSLRVRLFVCCLSLCPLTLVAFVLCVAPSRAPRLLGTQSSAIVATHGSHAGPARRGTRNGSWKKPTRTSLRSTTGQYAIQKTGWSYCATSTACRRRSWRSSWRLICCTQARTAM